MFFDNIFKLFKATFYTQFSFIFKTLFRLHRLRRIFACPKTTRRTSSSTSTAATATTSTISTLMYLNGFHCFVGLLIIVKREVQSFILPLFRFLNGLLRLFYWTCKIFVFWEIWKFFLKICVKTYKIPSFLILSHKTLARILWGFFPF